MEAAKRSGRCQRVVLAAFFAENPHFVKALKNVSSMERFAELIATHKVSEEMCKEVVIAIKNAPKELGIEIADAYKGGFKPIKNGHRIVLNLGKKEIRIRLMHAGSRQRNPAYFRITQTNKPAFDALGKFPISTCSNEIAAATHHTIDRLTLAEDILAILAKIRENTYPI